ncbi:MAG TPA: PaaI family thioesterase [Thermomicrobiales bacterium]|nr:PaaI family thioesterase [Thermomicrobiales bacterium]
MAERLATAEELNAWSTGTFVEHIGITILAVEHGRLTSEMSVRPELLAPNGYLHAGSIVALADTTCGFGARAHLPDGARGFTTIELKTNFLRTALSGTIDCEATLIHGGRTTQVWDATITERATGRAMAAFRCTQLILYPRE